MASPAPDGRRLYRYPELPGNTSRDHFRLVSISPEESSWATRLGVRKREGIRGRITVVAIDGRNDYDALSYCWSGHTLSSDARGLQSQVKEPRDIAIDTPDGAGAMGQIIPITPALGMALRYLRDRGAHRPIFIDQICINQGDVDERNRQVGLMGRIYGGCAEVLGWLGPAGAHSASLMVFASRLSRSSVLSKIVGDATDEYGQDMRRAIGRPGRVAEVVSGEVARDEYELRRLVKRFGSALPLKGVLDVFSRAWFRRMWIVQEACLPARLTLVCGRDSCSIHDLAKLHYFFSVRASMSADRLAAGNGISTSDMMSFLSRILAIRKAVVRGGSGDGSNGGGAGLTSRGLGAADLVMALNATNGATAKTAADTKFRATDSRDCIYGLLGLASVSDGAAQSIVPDYNKSVEEVFTEFAALAVRDNVDLLLYAHPERKAMRDLPSWVPDWSSDLTLPASYTASDAGHGFAAGKGTAGDPPSPAVVVEHGNLLVVLGLLLDRAEQVGRCWLEPWVGEEGDYLLPNETEFRSILAFCTEVRSLWEAALRKPESVSVRPEGGIDQAVWLTCTAGLGLLDSLEESILGHPVSGMPFLGFLFKNMIEVAEARSDRNGVRKVAINSQITIILDALYKQNERRCFVTSRGYVGLGPLGMRPDDEVVVLRGSSTPMVLRPGQTVRDAYTYVGEAYCHGVMYGEALRKNGQDGWMTFQIA
ncbi:heterokaryon incompatibility protein-domain-containing protein [Podospora didyma]|uniref:Heterokaryon incompatibility protein-domain-containing protein n=1 Tax=Podospora didyma TaxID=330526 RepID=A0AAE0U067_9PEZI|nr:heterokaryon incompatibility protein-domain-containing protein [Podospora didyma]